MSTIIPSVGLKEGESVLCHGKPSYKAFLGRIIIGIIFLFLGILFIPTAGAWLGLIFLPIGVVIPLRTILKVRSNRYFVTSRRVIRERRLVTRGVEETTLDHLTDIVFHQGLFGRILNVGNIHLHTAGTGFAGIDLIGLPDPMVWRGTLINAKDAYIAGESKPPEEPREQTGPITLKPATATPKYKCSSCNGTFSEKARFCPHCGVELET